MRGVSRFSVESFLSHIVGKIRGGDLLCFKQKSGIEKFHADEGGVQGYD